MQKTGIEWADYVANPVKGKCTVGCPYCYARKFYDRFSKPPFDDPAIRYDAKAFDGIDKIKKPSRIFVGSTIDLFCSYDDIPFEWINNILQKIEKYPKHTFIILTKRPKKAQHYLAGCVLPKNLWLGVTVTNQQDADERIPILLDIPAAVRFVSVEPLLGKVDMKWFVTPLGKELDWIIMGGLSPRPVHKKEWAEDMISDLSVTNIPLFLKANLHYNRVIQQFPEGLK